MRPHHTKDRGNLGVVRAQLRMSKGDVDRVCVYSPETERCYYLEPRRFGEAVKLRVEPTKNRQSKGVLLAERFTHIPWPLSSARIEQVPSKDKVAGSNPAGATTARKAARERR